MASYSVPTSFTAGRAVKLGGVSYAKGATIPNATVAATRHASALLAKRVIIPNIAQGSRKSNLAKPSPVTLSAAERRVLSGRAVKLL